MALSIVSNVSRRGVLRMAGLVGLGGLPWPAFGASLRAPLDFTAYRNGDRLGTHRIDFTEQGERLTVDIEIVFDVKLAFVPLYSYRHRNREVWRSGKLVSLDSETDDNGTDYKVSARREGDRLLVDGVDGRQELPGDTLSTSYWNEAAMAREGWLDTQRGELVRSKVTRRKNEPVMVEGREVQAMRYDLAGDITCSLWYADGRWVKLDFVGEDGSTIDYALEAPQQNG